MSESRPLSTSDKIGVAAFIGAMLPQVIPLNAATRSIFLLVALGAAIFLCLKSLWLPRKKWFASSLLGFLYCATVVLLFEQEARATKTSSPIKALGVRSLELLWTISWRWLLPGILAGFVLAVVFRRWQPQVPRIAEDTSQSSGVTKTESILTACPDDRPHEIMKGDRASIERRVRIPWIIYRPDFEGTEPYIDFVFSIFNNSLFDIVVNNSFKGDIWSDSFDNPLHYEPKFFPARSVVCRSRSGASFVIRHALRVEEVPRFKGRDDLLIWFDGLEITFAGTEQFPEINETRLNTKGFCLKAKEGAWSNPNDKDEFAFLYTDEQWALLKAAPPTGQRAVEQELILSADLTERPSMEIAQRQRVGLELKTARLDLGMSVHQLREKIKQVTGAEVGEATMRDIEAGKTPNPGFKTLEVISLGLGLNPLEVIRLGFGDP